MRISDWSSDVCSSDLCAARRRGIGRRGGKGGVALAGRGLLSRTRAQGWATRWRQRRRRKPSWRRRARKSVVEGKSVSVRVVLGGRRIITKKICRNILFSLFL